MSHVTDYPRRSKAGEPVWELASFYPTQGDWDEHDYLALNQTVLVEYDSGFVEFLPMPTLLHQLVVGAIYSVLKAWAETHGAVVVQAPMPLRVRNARYREPDLILLLKGNLQPKTDSFVRSADLVVEVVSEGKENRARDYDEKRKEYAESGIKEYWIVDPQEKRVTVLSLKGNKYMEHTVVVADGTVDSVLLEGLRAPLAALIPDR